MDKQKVLQWIDEVLKTDGWIAEKQDHYDTIWLTKFRDEMTSGRFDLQVSLQNAEQGKTIKYLQECLHEKNKALDAMGWVWCDGGCGGGVYRYTKKELTEEVLKKAEWNVKRLRMWFENNKYKKGILSN